MTESSKFKQYDKIPLNSSDWNKNYKKVKTWAVTEKVHGANFSFVYDVASDTFQFAKRGGLLKEEDAFFGYRKILDHTLPEIRKIVEKVLQTFENCEQVIVFGELFGGNYPGFESDCAGVQEGVYYSPHLHFYAFDIMIKKIGELQKYLDFEISIEMFQGSGVLFAEPLAIYPSYEKAAQHKIGFCTKIPEKFGLPEIGGNKAEGIVIRSMTQRFIVKLKIDEFGESKYSENHFDVIKASKNDKIQSWINICALHLTRNRLNNAISKVGDHNLDNEEEILNMLVDDILLEVNGFHIFGLRDVLLEQTILKFSLNK